MKNLKLLFGGAMILATGSILAQNYPHEMYVKDSKDVKFYEAYQNWQPGTPLYSDVADDEEFFISRVKPKTRFVNANTQVDKTMTHERQLLWWCPVGADGWNAIPSYNFDSEVFSMWSYVDIYGNWTAPFIRMPGAFADICHKNGVRTSVLASVPWAATLTANDGGHGSNINALNQGGSEKLLKFLRYYGIDGIGFNSEFSAPTLTPGLKTLLSDCFKNRESSNWPTFTNAWYSLMTNAGSVGGSDALSSYNNDWFHYNGYPTSDAYFMNYNWGASGLATSEATAGQFGGRSSYDVFGGMDFQGRSVADWTALKNSKISVGIWGAHNMNMMFEGRGELGADKAQRQKTYQLISQNVFSGATYNPVNDLPVKNILRHTAYNPEFMGFAKFLTAKSSLTTDNLAKEPFVTYFNLGNGKFFNVQGETTFNNQWYNIAMQDYLPTWRWWFTSTFMGRSTAEVPATGLSAEFTWDDAWFGGSCLSVSGKTELEYMQLFKTKYALTSGNTLTIRYKVVSGTGSIAWACGTEEKTDDAGNLLEISKTIGSDLAESENWVEKTFTIGTRPIDFNLAGQTLALMGLQFKNTSSDFKVLIGEITLKDASDAITPAQPTMVKTEMLKASYKGVDFKMIYKMKDRVAGSADPIYNADVNTWYYKVYSQQEGSEPVMCTATTSWAAYVVGAPLDLEGAQKMRVGISAVSVDGKSESAITWSDYIALPQIGVVEGIEIDKPVIKANEDFKVSYIDPTHAAADKWEILNAQTGEVVKTVNNSTSIETSLPANGIYDLRMTYAGATGTVENLYQSLIQISPDEVGAIPEIKSLTANKSAASIEVEEKAKVTLDYVGRPADGKVSRGMRLAEKAFGVPCEQLGFNDQSTFSICFWVNPSVFNHLSDGTQLLNVRSAAEGWPNSDWGYIYSMITPQNKLKFQIKLGSASGAGAETTIVAEDYTFEPNHWYHVAIVIGYNAGREISMYVNGKLIATKGGITDLKSWLQSYVMMIGGKAFNRAGFDGYLDEFQLYNKALSAEEVIKSMEHQSVIPESLIGYWDFESDADENNKIYSTGKKNYEAYTTEISTVSEGVNRYITLPMAYGTGAPFIAGNVYEITTTPTWEIKKSTLETASTGNDTAGSVGVSFANGGDYTAKLTLANGWGSASKTFQYITVKGSGVEGVDLDAELKAYPNPFVDNVNVKFATEGVYTVRIYNATGTVVAEKTTNVAAGQFIQIGVNANAGAYIAQILKDGKLVRAVKLLKK